MRFALNLVPAFAMMTALALGQEAKPTLSGSKAPMTVSETDKYILESIHNWVWSGFYSPKEVDEMIGDILEEDADESMLRAAVGPEFKKKKEAESSWPTVTDCDRLNNAFAAMEKRGVHCLQNAGYTMSDGHGDASEFLSKQPRDRYFGYCFYHGQDVERAVSGGGLMLAFDHIKGDVPDKLKVGSIVKEELEKVGLVVMWDGTADKRINIPHFDWKRRYKDGE